MFYPKFDSFHKESITEEERREALRVMPLILERRKILATRDQIIQLEVRVLIAQRPSSIYRSRHMPGTAEFRSLYEAILDATGVPAGPLTGQFVSAKEWATLQHYRGALPHWVSDPARRIFEVEGTPAVRSLLADTYLQQFIDRTSEVAVRRILLRITKSIPRELPMTEVMTRRLTVHVVDGKFSSSPIVRLYMSDAWDFHSFVMSACEDSRGTSEVCSRTIQHWRGHLHCREDFKSYIIPIGPGISVVAAIGA
jgi:hypothetical protein